MQRRTITIVWLGCIIGLICSGCSREDDAQQIRALIATGVGLAEEHDVSGLLALATEDVQAAPMDLDRRGIRGVLWRTFKAYGSIRILYPYPAIELDGTLKEASAQFPFLIVKKDRRLPDLERLQDDPAAWLEAVGSQADLYRLRLQLIQQGGAWLVERAMLERFSVLGFE